MRRPLHPSQSCVRRSSIPSHGVGPCAHLGALPSKASLVLGLLVGLVVRLPGARGRGCELASGLPGNLLLAVRLLGRHVYRGRGQRRGGLQHRRV